MADVKTVISRLFTSGDSPTEPAATGAAPSSPDPGAVDLKALHAQARKARNRPTKAQVAIQDADKQAALDELFENENWEVMAEMYFEVRYAMTDFEYFKLTDKQKRVLGKSMGTCMRLLLAIDPQWVALIVFSINFGCYAADKEMAYRRALKELEKRTADARAVNNGRANG